MTDRTLCKLQLQQIPHDSQSSQGWNNFFQSLLYISLSWCLNGSAFCLRYLSFLPSSRKWVGELFRLLLKLFFDSGFSLILTSHRVRGCESYRAHTIHYRDSVMQSQDPFCDSFLLGWKSGKCGFVVSSVVFLWSITLVCISTGFLLCCYFTDKPITVCDLWPLEPSTDRWNRWIHGLGVEQLHFHGFLSPFYLFLFMFGENFCCLFTIVFFFFVTGKFFEEIKWQKKNHKKKKRNKKLQPVWCASVCVVWVPFANCSMPFLFHIPCKQLLTFVCFYL